MVTSIEFGDILEEEAKKKSAWNWLRNMKMKNKELFKRAIKLNEIDGFTMYDQVIKNNKKWPLSRTSSMTDSSEELSEIEFDYEWDYRKTLCPVPLNDRDPFNFGSGNWTKGI